MYDKGIKRVILKPKKLELTILDIYFETRSWCILFNLCALLQKQNLNFDLKSFFIFVQHVMIVIFITVSICIT